jgi:hypothetical protein
MFFAESAIVVTAASSIYGGFENQATHPGEIRKAIVRVYEGPAPIPPVFSQEKTASRKTSK